MNCGIRAERCHKCVDPMSHRREALIKTVFIQLNITLVIHTNKEVCKVTADKHKHSLKSEHMMNAGSSTAAPADNLCLVTLDRYYFEHDCK